jgi:hypothetical protein
MVFVSADVQSLFTDHLSCSRHISNTRALVILPGMKFAMLIEIVSASELIFVTEFATKAFPFFMNPGLTSQL